MSAWMNTMQLVASDSSGQQIAAEIKEFMAPIAAVIIGVMGLKYLFGDQRSLAGFIGFLFLGIVIYVLIKFGDGILNALGGLFKSWVESNDPTPMWIMVISGAAILVGIVGIVVLWFLRERDGGAPDAEVESLEDQPPAASVEKPTSTVEAVDYTERALVELESLVTPGPTSPQRLRDQVELAIIVAELCGLLDHGSPVTPQHVAKWQVLLDQWPDLAAELRMHPDLLRILEQASAEEFVRGPELFAFLGSGPRLHPVVRHLLFLTPTPDLA